MLTCRFYSVSTSSFAQAEFKDSYFGSVSELIEIAKKDGDFEADTPVFDKRDIYDTLQCVDLAIVGRNFFGVLLTCASPLDILNGYSDESDESDGQFGYLKESIVDDAADELSSYLSTLQREGFDYDFLSALSQAVISAKNKQRGLILFYEDIPVETVSEKEFEEIQKTSVLDLFKRLGRTH